MIYRKIRYTNGTRLISLFDGKISFRYSKKQSLSNRIKDSLMLFKINKKHNETLNKIRKKYKNNQKINFAFFVINDSMNPAFSLINYIKNNNAFNCFIVIIPYMGFDKDKCINEMDKTYKYCIDKFPNIKVIHCYDKNNNCFIDISNQIDIACTTTPYGGVLYKFYRAEFLYSKSVLPIHIFYTTLSKDYYGVEVIISQQEIRYMWKAFVDTRHVVELAQKALFYPTNNLVISGYLKMDEFSKLTAQPKTRYRKTIILAPHHSIGDTVPAVMLSTFLKFSELYLELPKLYNNIKFIFRPHTFLRIRLEDDKYWGKDKTEKYFNTMANYSNVEYQHGGDYLQSFIDSDGIITDCGSFLMEYLYTNNPGCYILRNNETTDKMFNDFGKKCLEKYYIAFKEQDIINYIDDVILNENDIKKTDRIQFAYNEIKLNYPNVADFILKDIINNIENKV